MPERAFSQSAQSAQVLSVGQAAPIDEAGVSLMVPADGRLAGVGFETVVEGVAFSEHAGGPDDPVVAAPGAQLVVVDLAEHDFDQSQYLDYDPGTSQVSYTLESGTVSAGLQLGAASDGSSLGVVAISAGAPAILVASQAGFSQSFDLRAGRRVGLQPAALYRDATRPFSQEDLTATEDLTANGSHADPVTVQVAADSATLEYFDPGERLSESPADRAWLIVAIDGAVAEDASGEQVDLAGVLDGSRAALVLPDDRRLPGAAYSEVSDGELLAPIYAWQVSSTFSSATVVFDPTGGSVAASEAGASVELTFRQVARFVVSLPAPAPTPAQGYLHSRGGASRARPSGLGFWVALAAAALAVIVLAAVIVHFRRRRFDLPATPVTAARPALVDAALRALPVANQTDAASGVLELAAGAQPSSDAEPAERAGTVEAQAAAAPALVVRLLGALQVEGLRRPIRRESVRRLLVCLAVMDERPLGVEELRAALADRPDRQPKAESLRSYASVLRRALFEGLLPEAAPAGGYQLDPALLEVDWRSFAKLCARAEVAAGAERVEALCSALALVRGRPLAGRRWEGVEALCRHVESRVEATAAEAAAELLATGEPARADWAIGQGLLALPESVTLWESRLAAAAAGSGYGLERAWQDARSALGADAALIAGTYQRLKHQVGSAG